MSSQSAVEIRDLWFSYNSLPVLEGVNLVVGPRDFVAAIGPNGGGKTTLLKLMLGLIEPQRGEIRVLGKRPAQARAAMGYVPQASMYDPRFPVSVMDVVLMGRLPGRILGMYNRADRRAALEALSDVGLSDLRRRAFADLSGGQRQRVLIARALSSQPQLLLLDEPTANLDVAVEREFYSLLSHLNDRMAVVLVSHDVGFVSGLSGKVICVRGTVAVHPTEALTGDVLRDLYARDVRLVRHDHDCLHQDAPEGHAHE